MKKSKRYFLPAKDCDRSLIRAQMRVRFMHGLGFCDYYKSVPDPGEIAEAFRRSGSKRRS